jgi:hypothetical protein
MALTSTEDKNTGGLTVDGKSQTTTVTRTFTVVDDAFDAAAPPNENEAAAATGVFLGDTHPTFSNCFVTKYTSRREVDNPSVIRVTFSYESPELPASGGDTGDGSDDAYRQSINMNFGPKFEKLWRLNANPNSEVYDPSVEANTPADIGGDPTDTWGEIERPFLIVKPTVQITMRRAVQTSSGRNYLTELSNFVGTRNKDKFLGATEGNLLYVGATSRRLTDVGNGDVYEITHNFEYDKFKHQQQIAIPGTGVFGKAVGGSSDPERYLRKAFPVYWVQPYKGTSNFRNLGIDIR